MVPIVFLLDNADCEYTKNADQSVRKRSSRRWAKGMNKSLTGKEVRMANEQSEVSSV